MRSLCGRKVNENMRKWMEDVYEGGGGVGGGGGSIEEEAVFYRLIMFCISEEYIE